MVAGVWARAEPSQNHLPPTASLKSRLFHDFPLYLKIHENIEKPHKMALDRLEILYIYIHKPFWVQFHRISTFPSYFVYLMKNTNTRENVIF